MTAALDFENARYNMIEQQIRTWDVLDQDVLDLLFTVKREDYVPPALRALAFADLELPLGNGEKMWTPKMEARVLQELELKRGERVLEIGTGSGYFTALLASFAGEVLSVEIEAGFAREALTKLRRHAFSNVRVEVGDGARGYGHGAFDAIVLTGSTPVLPERFFEQLKPGGRIFAVIGDPPAMTAHVARWTAPQARVSTDLFETVIAPLKHAAAPARFTF